MQEAYGPPRSKSLGGGGSTYLDRGYLPWPRGYIPWLGGTYLGWGGYLPWLGGTYHGQGVPTLAGGGVPTLAWGGGVTYLGQYGIPPRCGQTDTCENSTFPSYYVRGRNNAKLKVQEAKPLISMCQDPTHMAVSFNVLSKTGMYFGEFWQQSICCNINQVL